MGEQLFFGLPMKKHEFLLGRDNKISVFCNVAATMHLHVRFQNLQDVLSLACMSLGSMAISNYNPRSAL
jgi:hypothetical protein